MHNRTTERQELARILQGGDSVQMLAPRRIGKTWLMHALAADLTKRGWLTVFIDVEGMRTEEEFLRALCQKLQETGSTRDRILGTLTQRLKQLISGWQGTPAEAIGQIDPRDFAEALVATLQDQDRDTLILVDEIALFMIERIKVDTVAARAFLYHLRRLQQAYPRVRWLLTGSIGLDVVARRERVLGALVDLHIFELMPFDEAAARSYLDSLCETKAVRRPFALGPDEFAYLADELGWLAPYYLKLVANQIEPGGDVAANGRQSARREDIDAAIARLLEPPRRGSFSTWEEHIDKNFPGEESSLLHRILYVCCEGTSGETTSTLLVRLQATTPDLTPRTLNDLLTALSNGGILHESGGRWRFRSGLLRRYWARYLHE